jgi:hypothetical protein
VDGSDRPRRLDPTASRAMGLDRWRRRDRVRGVVRILHPLAGVPTAHADDAVVADRVPWRWAHLAKRIGVPLTPLTRAEELFGEESEVLRLQELETVAPEIRNAIEHGPLLGLPHREYVLLTGGLDELADPTWVERARMGRGVLPGPQLIWPADHRWLVASEIDWDSTIVAGPRALIDAVLEDDHFEAFAVREDDDFWGGVTARRDP